MSSGKKYKQLDLSKKNQLTEVYTYMQNHGSITEQEAFNNIGAERLSALIYDLRHIYGIEIVTENITVKDRFGTIKTVGRYKFGTVSNITTKKPSIRQNDIDSWFTKEITS